MTKKNWEVRRGLDPAGQVQLLLNGRVVTSWDPVQHPHWPPVDADGELIGDVPWRFFDP